MEKALEETPPFIIQITSSPSTMSGSFPFFIGLLPIFQLPVLFRKKKLILLYDYSE